jgi:hypothetical protein
MSLKEKRGGISGSGYFAIIFASALSVTVAAISHSVSKVADAMFLVAIFFLYTSNKNWWVERNEVLIFCFILALLRTSPLSSTLACWMSVGCSYISGSRKRIFRVRNQG